MGSLSQGQVTQLKQQLLDRHARLREEIRTELLQADEEAYSDLAGKVHDSGEESVADLLADMSIARIDRQVAEVRAIEGALRRVDMGSYGTCEDCGTEIGYERMRSYPTAGRCITCQSRHERAYAHESTPTL